MSPFAFHHGCRHRPLGSRKQSTFESLESRNLLHGVGIASGLEVDPPGQLATPALLSQAADDGPYVGPLRSGALAELAANVGYSSSLLMSVGGPSVPVYHSLPSAAAKLFLDFDGHFEPDWAGATNVTTPVYSADGDYGSFSSIELEFIQNVWKIVAEDYAPFNIDVTTEEPAVLAAGVPIDQANGVALRIAIGGKSDWTGGSYAGIAQMNSFTNSVANVSYVFAGGSAAYANYGSVASHEAAHAFGLAHQSLYDANGNFLAEYRPPQGDWAPIMGDHGSLDYATWSNGTSTGASTFQDDMAIIAGPTNGFGYRADDVGNTPTAASALSGSGLTWSGSGLIESTADVDVFAFTLATSGEVRISVDGNSPGQNLDAVLDLRDSSGALITSSNPLDSTDAFMVRSLAAGTYYVGVRSSGVYGRVGQYAVTVAPSAAGITVAAAAAPRTTSEGARQQAFSVVLDGAPTSDVTLAVASSDPTEGTVSATSLTFTPTNWSTPQTVIVVGVDDAGVDGDVSYTVSLSPAVSADPNYAGIDPDDLKLVNLDNDAFGYVYWVDGVTDLVQRSTLGGENVQTLVDLKAQFGGVGADHAPRYIAIDSAGGKMYWTDTGSDTIRRANLDGSGVQTLLSGLGDPRPIAIDSAGGKMYWLENATNKIRRANLDGTGAQDLVVGAVDGGRELELDLAAHKMYWTDINNHMIRRANLDGSQIEVLQSGGAEFQPSALELDTTSGKMYFSDYGPAKDLYRATLSGTQNEFLLDTTALDANAAVHGLAIDRPAGRLVFSELFSGALYVSSLDGTNLAQLVGNLGDPQGVAVYIPPPGVTVTPTSGLTTTEAGGSATFSVALNAPPTANVVIPLSSSDTTEGTVSSPSLTFTPSNWKTPQTVTITGVDDAIYDGNVTYSAVVVAASSGDARYQGINPPDVSLTNTDNDPPPTKFYVVDDATANKTFEYGATGSPVESYALNSGNTSPRGAASTSAGDKAWVVDTNRNVYVYNTSGGLLGSWAAGTLANNAQPEGIATNGTDIWIVDARSDKVFKYAGAATRLSGSQTAASSFSLNSANADPTDIVTDGASLWVTNNNSTDKVFKYTVAGSLLGSWTITSGGGSPTGLTIDPASPSDIWIVDSATDRVYQYTGAASRTSGSQTAETSFALASGNGSPQGIADPPPNHLRLSKSFHQRMWQEAGLGAAYAAHRGGLAHVHSADEAAHNAVWASWH